MARPHLNTYVVYVSVGGWMHFYDCTLIPPQQQLWIAAYFISGLDICSNVDYILPPELGGIDKDGILLLL